MFYFFFNLINSIRINFGFFFYFFSNTFWNNFKFFHSLCSIYFNV